MRVSVNIVTFNSLEYIDDCLKSLFDQTFTDFRILVVDNASDDGTVQHIRQHYPTVTVLQNFQNLGFAKAHNQAIKFWDSDYVLVMNPDVALEPNCLHRLVTAAEQLPNYGSFCGKTLRWNRRDADQGIRTPDSIDSTAISIGSGWRFYDQGAGEEDRGQFEQSQDVFGCSGHLALYRRQALEAVALPISKRNQQVEYFDELFFMYKEDIDLAWRLQWASWPARYIPQAEAKHIRSGFGHATGDKKMRQAIADRRRKSQFINGHSYTNHALILRKNLTWGQRLQTLPATLWYEIKKLGWIILFEQKTLAAIGKTLRLWNKAGWKHRQIMQRRTATSADIMRWYNRQ